MVDAARALDGLEIDVEGFARDGATVVRGVLSPDEVALLASGIDANLAAPSERAKVASRAGDPGEFVEDFCTWQDNAAYEQIIRESRLAALGAVLMRSTTVRLYHDHMLTKQAGTDQRTPWHQDQPYYNVEGRQNVSLWVPVDPVPVESTLEFVAGSHLGPWLMPRSFMDDQARWFPEGTLAEMPDIDAQRAAGAVTVLVWALDPGDVVAFNMLTVHAAAGAATRRRVFSLRLLGDDMVHAPRAWTTSPEFPGLAERLAPGAPLDDPLFPLLVP